jgi:hypothetical protein
MNYNKNNSNDRHGLRTGTTSSKTKFTPITGTTPQTSLPGTKPASHSPSQSASRNEIYANEINKKAVKTDGLNVIGGGLMKGQMINYPHIQ